MFKGKSTLFWGAHLILIMLLLTSVASSQFMRITGDPGEGYGYGYGYGEGYGWDADFGNFTGFRFETDGLGADEYGYGFGFSYESYTGSYHNDDETYYDTDENNFIYTVMSGVVEILGMQQIDGGDTIGMTGLKFLFPLKLSIGGIATTTIDQDTTFTVEGGGVAAIAIADPNSEDPENPDTIMTLTSTSTVDVTGLPANYTAIENGAIQFGLPDVGLVVSPPITITIDVGEERVGQTLRVLRQDPGSSDWDYLAECVVGDNGWCEFTTDHLSSFATASYTASAADVAESTPGSNPSGYVRFFNPAGGNSPVIITKTLKYGSFNPEVKKLQQFLKDQGYLRVRRANNYFGLMVRWSLMKFQKANGLKATGVVDLATRRLLQQQ